MIIKKRKQIKEEKQKENKKVEIQKVIENENELNAFDLDNIDFSQRKERRKGDRRRGYRRIDDRNLVSRAQEEAREIKENAAKEGFQYGLSNAQTQLSEIKNQIEDFVVAKQKMYDDFSKTILDISIDIAEKIIKKEVSEDKKILLNIINEVLEELSRDEQKITIIVNPEDIEYAKEILPEIISKNNIEAKIVVLANQEVDNGFTMVEATNGIIDATLKTQLSVIKEAFKGI